MRLLASATLAALLTGSVLADTTAPPEARAHFDKAEIAREQGRMEEAAELYRKAIEAFPLYDEAHAGYLAALRSLGDFAQATVLYEKLAADHPDDVDLKAFRAAAAYSGEALVALEALAKEHGDNVRVCTELGRVQLVAGEFRDAERSLKDAIRADAKAVTPQILLAEVYLRDGKYTRARKILRDLLEAEPTNVPAQLRLALVEHRDGDTEDALKILGTLVSEDNLPNLVAGHWLLAVIRAEAGNLDEAVQSMDRVLAIDKDDYDALYAKGVLLLRQTKPTEAAQAFERATAVRPRSSAAVFALGWAHERSADAPEIEDAQVKERLAKAAEAYEKCASMDPGVRPRDALGFVYLLSQKHQDAVTQFKRAKDIDPEFAPTLNNLGLAQDMADNRSAAKKRYEDVLDKIDKSNVRARVMLALDLWLDGNASKAIKELERALKIREDDDLAWTFLGDIHYDGGSSAGVNRAIKCYKEAVALNDQNFYAWYHMGIAYDDDRRRDEEAEACYEKALALRLNPPVELLLRLAEVNDDDGLDRPEKALQYYQAYVDAGGPVDGILDWIPARIEELKEQLKK